MFNNTGIRVNAWVTCFLDADGNWINPAGTTYTYTVKVTKKVAVKTLYKSWYKSWYKYKGKWHYVWKYVWKTKITYKTVTTTEKKTGLDTSHNTQVLNAIIDMVKNYGVDGINLDYVRYPGTAYKYSGSTQIITSFVKSVYNSVKSINKQVAVSADLMPEKSENAYYYGQNYTQLAQYLDFMVPMIYAGNYGYNSSTGTNSSGQSSASWISSTVQYIVSQANGTPVVAGLQAYRSDDNITPIPASELQNDINAAINNGSSGYALFKYGYISSDFIHINITNSNGTVTAEGTPLPPEALIDPEYLKATTNCQVNDPKIQSLELSITKGLNSSCDEAVAIFDWVRDKLGYSFYYNTKYGAVGTLNAGTGNCCDTANLLIALERAAGIPARYEFGYCQFSSGNWYGHVWAQVFVNGNWYRADATSTRNSFGVINNWNTATATIYCTYASLPF